MGKVFCTGNQWFIGVWKDCSVLNKLTQFI